MVFVMSERVGGLAGITGTGRPALLAGGAKAILVGGGDNCQQRDLQPSVASRARVHTLKLVTCLY